jgi:phospholipid/cholesterol/gamma-HCH transport system ATP-binding protein
MLIIYDEPFVGLDPIALNQILKLIRMLNDTLGITSILVAHELAAVRQIADEIYLLAGGKIAAHGAPDDLARGDTAWTKQFFTGAADGPVPFQYPAPDYATQLGLAGAGRVAAALAAPTAARAVPASAASQASNEGVAARHSETKA